MFPLPKRFQYFPVFVYSPTLSSQLIFFILVHIRISKASGLPTIWRRGTQMLHDLVNDDGFVALKRAAEDRGMETQRKDVKKPAVYIQ